MELFKGSTHLLNIDINKDMYSERLGNYFLFGCYGNLNIDFKLYGFFLQRNLKSGFFSLKLFFHMFN